MSYKDARPHFSCHLSSFFSIPITTDWSAKVVRAKLYTYNQFFYVRSVVRASCDCSVAIVQMSYDCNATLCVQEGGDQIVV